MSDTATEKLPDHPTQDQVRDAAEKDGVATFRAETDPKLSPVKEHREAHAEGGEYGPRKRAASSSPASKRTAPKSARKSTAAKS